MTLGSRHVTSTTRSKSRKYSSILLSRSLCLKSRGDSLLALMFAEEHKTGMHLRLMPSLSDTPHPNSLTVRTERSSSAQAPLPATLCKQNGRIYALCCSKEVALQCCQVQKQCSVKWLNGYQDTRKCTVWSKVIVPCIQTLSLWNFRPDDFRTHELKMSHGSCTLEALRGLNCCHQLPRGPPSLSVQTKRNLDDAIIAGLMSS